MCLLTLGRPLYTTEFSIPILSLVPPKKSAHVRSHRNLTVIFSGGARLFSLSYLIRRRSKSLSWIYRMIYRQSTWRSTIHLMFPFKASRKSLGYLARHLILKLRSAPLQNLCGKVITKVFYLVNFNTALI